MHIMVRGVGKQTLFVSNSDRLLYLGLLHKYRDENEITILAYCLMDNHVHLLIHDPNKHISEFMHYVNGCYASYFNSTYERVGHLFQNRFQSENIFDEQYLLAAFKYILMNPEKAGICPAHKYPWSSFDEYSVEGKLTDSTLIEDLLGPGVPLKDIILQDSDVEVLDTDMPKHDDTWAQKIIQKVTGQSSGFYLQSIAKSKRDPIIHELRHRGLTLKQLMRLTGLSYGVLQRA